MLMRSNHKKTTKEELKCLNTLATKLETTELCFNRKDSLQIIL